MRLIALSLITLLTFSSCNVKNNETQKEAQRELIYNEVDNNGRKMLKGEINEEVFTNNNYAWYANNYAHYTLDKPTIDSFKKDLDDVDVTVFMGTWCSDSQRETPNFFKIMNYAQYPDSKIHMYAVDRSKKALNGEEQGKNISHVPTFIFYKNGKEIGRIVESPVNTLEQDIHDIVKGNPQTPHYAQ